MWMTDGGREITALCGKCFMLETVKHGICCVEAAKSGLNMLDSVGLMKLSGLCNQL